MDERTPLITAPIYIDGAPVREIAPKVQEVAKKAAPLAGLLGATALGVTAAYFAPKFFDWALEAFRGRYDDDDGEEVDLEID